MPFLVFGFSCLFLFHSQEPRFRVSRALRFWWVVLLSHDSSRSAGLFPGGQCAGDWYLRKGPESRRGACRKVVMNHRPWSGAQMNYSGIQDPETRLLNATADGEPALGYRPGNPLQRREENWGETNRDLHIRRPVAYLMPSPSQNAETAASWSANSVALATFSEEVLISARAEIGTNSA